MNDSAWRDNLDLAWDRLVQSGDPGAVDDADVLTRLHRLQAAADAPLSGRTRRWVAPRRSRRAFRLPAARLNLAHAYALLSALLLVTMSGAFSMSRGIGYSLASATPIPAIGGPKLYRVDQTTGAWQGMNPLTLADLPGGSSAGLATPTPNTPGEKSTFGLISADGSTIVRFVYRADAHGNLQFNAPDAFEVYDAGSTALRSRIDSMSQAYAQAISNDGTRLSVVETEGSGSDWSITGVKVYDTQSSTVISSLNLSSATSAVLEYPVFDSTSTHAYVLSRSVPATGAHARDVQVTEYDLATGKQIHGLTITNLLQDANDPIVESPTGEYVTYHGMPGMGLSPDDQTLAILSPSAPQITLIDASRWKQVLRPTIATESGASCFGDSPAFFSTPTFVGDRIVATGFAYAAESLGTIDVEKSAICSIQLPAEGNVARGVSKALNDVLPADWLFRWTSLSSDGTNLYAIGIKQVAPGTVVYSDYGIFRLNPETLTIEAEADYPIPSNDLAPFDHGLLLAFAPPN